MKVERCSENDHPRGKIHRGTRIWCRFSDSNPPRPSYRTVLGIKWRILRWTLLPLRLDREHRTPSGQPWRVIFWFAWNFKIFVPPPIYAPNSLGATFLTLDSCFPLNFEPQSTNNSPIARSQACIFDFFSKPMCLFGTEGVLDNVDRGQKVDFLSSPYRRLFTGHFGT